jgi:hypothetical protein
LARSGARAFAPGIVRLWVHVIGAIHLRAFSFAIAPDRFALVFVACNT